MALCSEPAAEFVLRPATGKHVDTLLEVFGERLVFPGTFVGRGDMSRGGLRLRAARSSEERCDRPIAAPRATASGRRSCRANVGAADYAC